MISVWTEHSVLLMLLLLTKKSIFYEIKDKQLIQINNEISIQISFVISSFLFCESSRLDGPNFFCFFNICRLFRCGLSNANRDICKYFLQSRDSSKYLSIVSMACDFARFKWGPDDWQSMHHTFI